MAIIGIRISIKISHFKQFTEGVIPLCIFYFITKNGKNIHYEKKFNFPFAHRCTRFLLRL